MRYIKLTIAVLILASLISCTTYIVPRLPIINLGIHDKEQITLRPENVKCAIDPVTKEPCAFVLLTREAWTKTQFRYKLYRQGYESQVKIVERNNRMAK